MPTDGHASRGWVIKTQQEFRYGAFPRTARTNNANSFTRFDSDVEFIQSRF